MSSYRRRRRRIAEMNVVPYIDVMLVLLIIFMITSPLLTEGLNIEVPQAGEGTEPITLTDEKGNLILVSMDSDGHVFWQDDAQPLSDDELVVRLLALLRTSPHAPILVRGDENLAYGEVMRVMSLLKEYAPRAKITLVTRRY